VNPVQALSRGVRAAGATRVAEDQQLFLGENFFPWLILAFGAAMVVGNVLALVRPRDGERPPVARSVVMIGVGLVAAVWGIASFN
jgi:hypothetical protein